MFMTDVDTDTVMIVFMIIILAVYFIFFYIIILKQSAQRQFLRTFHNAVCSIYAEMVNKSKGSLNPDYLFKQFDLNYEKLCQSNPNNDYSSVLDLLETIIYYYDACSNAIFKKIFRQEKKTVIRNFIMEMCLYIQSINPFISIPQKEADLMQSIKDALDNNNKSLGLNSLKQLSQEILVKEKLLVKKDKENQRAVIISIVGIVLTVFFGFFSIFPILQ